MAEQGLQAQVTALLERCNAEGGYESSLVCTDRGLVIASAGGGVDEEDTAAFTSLFDDVVLRARRDIGFRIVDEVTLLDPGRGRVVIRPIPLSAGVSFYLVVSVPTDKSWRRNTNRLCKELPLVLSPLVEAA